MISLIVDDIEDVHDQIRALSGQFFPDIRIIDTASSVKEGIEKINRYRPELLFLDVELPDGLGFQILEEVEEVPPYIVFISGHSHFAVQAFRFEAVYFIHKPIEEEQFREAVERAKSTRLQQEQLRILQEIVTGSPSRRPTSRLSLRSEDRIAMVNVDEIIALGASGNYTEIYLGPKGKKEVTTQLLRTCEEKFAGDDRFMKVHRSWSLNLEKVQEVQKRNRVAVMANQMEIPVSTRYWRSFCEKLEDL